MSPASPKPRTGATLAIVSLALFMVVLDNLVVTVALPAIRADLGATLQSLEWTINAYTLAFAACSSRAPRWAIASAAGGCSSSACRSSPHRAPPRRWRRPPARSSPPAPCRASAARSSRR